jgi:hypothetical protein
MAETPQYLTVAEAATLLGVTPQAVYTKAANVNCPLVASYLPNVAGQVGMVFARADVAAEKARMAARPRRGPVAGAKAKQKGAE